MIERIQTPISSTGGPPLLVLGNRAGDLDSTVCALTAAELIRPYIQGNPVRPLLAGQREDLRRRPEILGLFAYLELELSPGDFAEGPEAAVLKSDRGCPLFLVDHNRPEPGWEGHPVRGIIDHHTDQGVSPALPVRIIEPCGSCASLISREWNSGTTPPDPKTALMLAAAIITDTGDFNPDWGKTTPLDRREYSRLMPFLSDRDRLFLKGLNRLKEDLSGLTTADHLHRDGKVLTGKTGDGETWKGEICSVPLTGDLFFRSGFFDFPAVRNFCREQDLDILIIMHTGQEPFRRELSFFLPPLPENRRNRQTIIKKQLPERLLGLAEPQLRNCPPPLPLPEDWFWFRQDNPRTSRKRLLPLLKQELDGLLT